MKFKVTIGIYFILLIAHMGYGQRCIYKDSKNSMNHARLSGSENIQIGLVFHVVYATEEQNINNQEIYEQLEVLNQCFNEVDYDAISEEFKDLAIPVGIRFGIAMYDEFQNPTTGITRTYTSHGPFGNMDIIKDEKGGKTPWKTENYVNVWICDLGGQVIGMTGSPDDNQGFDGIVIDYKAFGLSGTATEPYHLGKTLVHEMGHYLGLLHLEGVAGGCDDDDGISDTPNQEHYYTSCITGASSCGSLDMVQNYMSLSGDDCMLFFTKGQKEAMYAFYNTYRTELTSEIHDARVLSISTDNKIPGLNIFPNPFGKYLFIEGNYLSVELYALTGSRIEIYENEGQELPMDDIKPGVYILQVNTPKAKQRIKLIKSSK